MSCVHVVEVERVHALSCLRRSLGGLDPICLFVCLFLFVCYVFVCLFVCLFVL